MKLIFEMDYDQKINIIKFFGTPKVEHFLMYLRTIRKEITAEWIIMLDMRFSNPDFSIEDLDTLTNAAMEVNKSYPIYDVVIVTKDPLAQNQAAIWELLRKPKAENREIKVVPDMTAALVAVGSLRSKPIHAAMRGQVK